MHFQYVEFGFYTPSIHGLTEVYWNNGELSENELCLSG